MISRFVVVPAIPTETGPMRSGSRFYCQTAPIGFNLYDNQEKLRLKTTYQARAEAESECQRLNVERLQRVTHHGQTLGPKVKAADRDM